MSKNPSLEPRRRPYKIKADPFADLDQTIAQARSENTNEFHETSLTPVSPSTPEKVARPTAQSQGSNEKDGQSLVACPYLGIAGDPATRFLEPDPGHRCFGLLQPSSISEERQRGYCLSSHYSSCENFLSAQVAMSSSPAKRAQRHLGWLFRLFGKE